MRSVALFNNRGGVGKTMLVYHLAAMFSELGARVLAVDLDPQANLTAMCVADQEYLALWPDGSHPRTLLGAVEPVMNGTGGAVAPKVIEVDPRFALLAGDLALGSFEGDLAQNWRDALNGSADAVRRTTAFARIVTEASADWNADLVLIDVGSNLGALNRAALIAADHVIVPLAPDPFALQALRSLGPALGAWQQEWRDRDKGNLDGSVALPQGGMQPMGYVVLHHAMRLDRPVFTHGRWMQQIRSGYSRYVIGCAQEASGDLHADTPCLGTIRNYRSLMPLAVDSRKPMFALQSADGALGAYRDAVGSCYREFRELTKRIARRLDVDLPLLRGLAS